MTRKGSADGRATAPWLVGDIGATNLRLALARPADGGFSLDAVERWPIAGIDGIEAALERYLAGIASARPTVGALAIAGPVTGDALAITNAGWRWSCDAVQTQFGFRKFVCLNDAEAQA